MTPDQSEPTQPAASDATTRLARLEHQLAALASPLEHAALAHAHRAEAAMQPAWRRVTQAEPRWPVSAVIVVMLTLQAVVPARLAPSNRWLLPALEAALLAVLIASDPRRISQRNRLLRGLSLALIAVASVANGWALGHLVRELLHGTGGDNPGPLLATGANLWLTNVIIFGLWFWEFDRGGPQARAAASDPDPDFLFPQMAAPADYPHWEPQFLDYLYVSFTNAAAFSPTDTMPMSRWAKTAMMAQSAISLVTAALVIARAVNVLK